jgi:hypothetical protein
MLQMEREKSDHDAPGLEQADLLNGKAPSYIVGFSEASAHRCTPKLPILPLDSYPPVEVVGCDELAAPSSHWNSRHDAE